MAGYRHLAFRRRRLDQRRGARRRAGRRSRQLWVRRAAADRSGRGPPRPAVGVRRRATSTRSLLLTSIRRRVARVAGHARRAVAAARCARCPMALAASSRARRPLAPEVAERPAGRRRQDRRHPARGRGDRGRTPAVVVGIGVNVARIRTIRAYPADDAPLGIDRRPPKRCSRARRRLDGRTLERIWDAGRGFAGDPPALALARARHRRAGRRQPAGERAARRRVRGRSTTTARSYSARRRRPARRSFRPATCSSAPSPLRALTGWATRTNWSSCRSAASARSA